MEGLFGVEITERWIFVLGPWVALLALIFVDQLEVFEK
jgi:hypothetical protein